MNLGLEMWLPPGFHYARGSDAVWRGGVEVHWNQREKVEKSGDEGSCSSSRAFSRVKHGRFPGHLIHSFGISSHESPDRDAKRGLSPFAIWIAFETMIGIVRENTTRMTQLSRTILRAALVALGLLMVPLVASQVVDGWNWGAGGFVFAYVLFFGTVLAYALIAPKMGAWAYKAGVALALATGLVMGWSNMVHLSESDNPANLMYFGVLVLGGVGAWLARLEALGLAWALFAMAAVMAALSVILSSAAPVEIETRVAIGHGVFVVLFTASGLLFRHASLAGPK